MLICTDPASRELPHSQKSRSAATNTVNLAVLATKNKLGLLIKGGTQARYTPPSRLSDSRLYLDGTPNTSCTWTVPPMSDELFLHLDGTTEVRRQTSSGFTFTLRRPKRTEIGKENENRPPLASGSPGSKVRSIARYPPCHPY